MTPIPQDAQRAYAITIWTDFLLKAKMPPTRIMSPLEFGLVSEWIAAGVPLRIVLRAFRDTQGHKAGSLLYYRQPVAEAYRMWRAALGPAA
jgi:hypothetical protein